MIDFFMHWDSKRALIPLDHWPREPGKWFLRNWLGIVDEDPAWALWQDVGGEG